jgi:VanZ family protein
VYLAFVIYGSLVPFDFRPRSFDVALRGFLNIRYLRLGVESRADWVANILLYIPLSFLWLGSVSREGRHFLRLCFSMFILIFFVVLAIAVEFAQQFFPPRTVSLNDIFAEAAGTLLGIVLWWALGDKIRRLLESLFAQGESAAYGALAAYVIGYFGFSLFPYDFLISMNEIRAKLASEFFHWLPRQSMCDGTLRCGAKLTAEAVAVAPLGVLIAFVSKRSGGSLWQSAAWAGGWLGILIEALQVLLVSGISLGVSVLTRVIGVVAGAAVGDVMKGTSLWPLLYLFRPFVPVAGAVYVVLVMAVTWLGKGPLLRFEEGIRRLDEIRFLPFYYHYYTSESAAMTSLLAVAIMFIPIGVFYWIRRVTVMREFAARGAFEAALIGAALSAGTELGKLFLRGARPDPTNVMIALFAAAIGFIGATVCTKASLSVAQLERDAADD